MFLNMPSARSQMHPANMNSSWKYLLLHKYCKLGRVCCGVPDFSLNAFFLLFVLFFFSLVSKEMRLYVVGSVHFFHFELGIHYPFLSSSVKALKSLR